jgi:hypothetical protein
MEWFSARALLCIDGHLSQLRERGKYAIYAGMFSGFAALRIMSHRSACAR